MDVTKLSPAPWIYGPAGDCDEWICIFPNGEDVSVLDETHAEFIALARNAFDVMMRRGWHAEFRSFACDGVPERMWTVFDRSGYKFLPLGYQKDRPKLSYFYAADPFTALVEADKWYKEHVEKGGAT